MTVVDNCSFLFCQQEANVDTQLTDIRVKRRSLRHAAQKCDPEKGVYIEFGKICCRSALVELMYNACKVTKGDDGQSLCKCWFFSLSPKMGTWTIPSW